jgi:hypothetical protein
MKIKTINKKWKIIKLYKFNFIINFKIEVFIIIIKILKYILEVKIEEYMNINYFNLIIKWIILKNELIIIIIIIIMNKRN